MKKAEQSSDTAVENVAELTETDTELAAQTGDEANRGQQPERRQGRAVPDVGVTSGSNVDPGHRSKTAESTAKPDVVIQAPRSQPAGKEQSARDARTARLSDVMHALGEPNRQGNEMMRSLPPDVIDAFGEGIRQVSEAAQQLLSPELAQAIEEVARSQFQATQDTTCALEEVSSLPLDEASLTVARALDGIMATNEAARSTGAATDLRLGNLEETGRKSRGRKSKFSPQQLEQAVQMKSSKKSNNEIAKELYGTTTPTSDQRRSVPTILKYHDRKSGSKK
jgi:hypothetical protein